MNYFKSHLSLLRDQKVHAHHRWPPTKFSQSPMTPDDKMVWRGLKKRMMMMGLFHLSRQQQLLPLPNREKSVHFLRTLKHEKTSPLFSK